MSVRFEQRECLVVRDYHGNVGKLAYAGWESTAQLYWKFCSNGSGHCAQELRDIASELDRRNALENKLQDTEVKSY